MVADGHKVLLLGSFGYQNGGIQIARRNPDVSIIHASGFMVEPNFSPFTAKYWQGTYLMGMAAASLTKTKVLGCVGAFAIPELITSINAFMLGARSVDPEITMKVVWVNSWFDPAAEQDAARALISQECDVIFSNAQDTPSVVAVAEEAGVYVFNLNSSMLAYAPTKYLGVVGTDWGPYFKAKVDAHVAGTFQGEIPGWGSRMTWSSPPTGMPTSRPTWWRRSPNGRRPLRMAAFVVFQGPLVDQDGTERYAAGVAMTDEEILAKDWHVEGVLTPLPN